MKKQHHSVHAIHAFDEYSISSTAFVEVFTKIIFAKKACHMIFKSFLQFEFFFAIFNSVVCAPHINVFSTQCGSL